MIDVPSINPRRMYRGTGASAAAANNFVGLFNNTVGNEFLVVWGFSIGAAAIWTAQPFNAEHSAGALVMAGQPVFMGEAVGPGQIFNGANPAGITGDYQIGNSANQYVTWNFRAPFAIVLPNWMCGFTNGAGALATVVSFLWQVVKAEELIAAPA